MSTPLGATNPAVQRLRRLARRRSSRSTEGVYLIDGPVLLAEALEAGVEIEAVFAEGPALDANPVRRAAASGVDVRPVEDGVLSRALDVVTPQHVVTVARRRQSGLAEILPRAVEGSPLLLLVELQDPGNAGTILRVAEATGCAGVILTRGSVDTTNPKAVRASAGSVFRVPVAEGADPVEVLAAVRSAGLRSLATVKEEASPYVGVDLSAPFALVVGNEARGLPSEVLACCDALVSIPMAGQVESLNAAVAGAVILFEAARQRGLRRQSPLHGAPAQVSEWPSTGGPGPQ